MNPDTVTRRGFLAAATTTGLVIGGAANPMATVSDPPLPDHGTDRSGPLPAPPVIGANLNGRPYRLSGNLDVIDVSNTTWIRAFLDIRNKNTNGMDPDSDPDVEVLRQAAREKNCKLIVSLKWDFKANWGDKDQLRVPSPGSTQERELYACATRYLEAIGAPIDIVVLGNEPMWETLDPDIKVRDPPIVRFTRDLKDYLVQNGEFGDPAYLVGSFNRSNNYYTREIQYRDFHREMFAFAREDTAIAGIDLHVHFNTLSEARDMIATGRENLPDGEITVTEFSPVWRYDQHIDTPIGRFPAGARFARDYGVSPDMTAVEYFEDAKAAPRSPTEIGDFYDAMPWYNTDHLTDMYRVFDEYDVSIGTFGFLQGLEMRGEDWTIEWTPFHINFLFQPALLQTDQGITRTAHPHYIEDYRRLTTTRE